MVAVERLPRFKESEAPPLRHPLTAGVATAGLLGLLLITFNLVPQTDPAAAFYGPFALPTLSASLPVAGCIAAFYFTGCAALEWLRVRLFQAAPPEPDSTLTIE